MLNAGLLPPGSVILASASYPGGENGEHRGPPTTLTHSGVGTITGAYDADGQLASQRIPSAAGGAPGATTTWVRDTSGDVTGLSVDPDGGVGGDEWWSETQVSTVHGQWAVHTATTGAAAYSYDNLGRLVGVSDRPAAGFGGCADRVYTFDADSNRTGKSQTGVSGSWTLGGMSGTCTAAATATVSASFDTASRITGATHDELGRVTTLPAAASGLSAAVTSTFRVDDLAVSVSDGTTTRTYGRDPLGRVRLVSTGGGAETWHYGDTDGDSPWWVQAAAGVITRYLPGLDGRLLATTTHSSGGAQTAGSWQVADLHGDVATTTPVLTGVQASPGGYVRYDEYGTPASGTPGRYGWLGGQTRPGGDTTAAGILLMGVRLYAPTLGRFLSVDPVPGGNDNPYIYPADPLTATDLTGLAGMVMNYGVTYFPDGHIRFNIRAQSLGFVWNLANVAIAIGYAHSVMKPWGPFVRKSLGQTSLYMTVTLAARRYYRGRIDTWVRVELIGWRPTWLGPRYTRRALGYTAWINPGAGSRGSWGGLVCF